MQESRSVKTGIRGCHGVVRPAPAAALFIYETRFSHRFSSDSNPAHDDVDNNA